MDAQTVASCLPGAQLEGAEDEHTYLGNIKVRVGAITTSYKGRVRFTSVDEAGRAVEMSAEGRETGGGTARGVMSSRVRAIEDGRTEVTVDASLEITGRIAQMGRGMIEGVSKQLFQQFVACVSATIEAPAGEAAPKVQEAVSVLPLVLGVIWSSIARFFRKLLRRGPSGEEPKAT
jgi:carbon monoxide dehydrogenase subunit G